MSDDPRLTAIETYLEQLSQQLKGLADCHEIIHELKSHFDDRLGREPYLVTEDLFKGFAAPEVFARAFLDTANEPARVSSSRLKVLMQPLRLASVYLLIFLTLSSAVLKLIFPQRVGLWFNQDSVSVYLLSVSRLEGHDVFGYWLVPVSLIVGLGLYWLTRQNSMQKLESLPSYFTSS